MKLSETILKDIANSANKEAQFAGQPQSLRRAYWELETAAIVLKNKLIERKCAPDGIQ